MRYIEKIFHVVVISSFIGLIAGVAHANTDSYTTEGRIVNKEPIYTNVQQRNPYQECYTVDVPIYGNVGGGASAGDVLGGMIIGGLLGKGATGKDNGAAAGAVIGGMIAADKNRGQETIIGYRQENRCNNITRYNTESQEVYSHSTVTFWDNGKKYTLRFTR